MVGAPASNQALVVESLTGVVTRWFPGATPGDQFGIAVASGRDLTGDGIPDHAIGAPSDDVGATDSGSVAIYSGSNGLLVRTLRGLAAGDRFGSAIALVPDANGDGRADLVIGAPRADGPGSDAGAVYVYSGTSGLLIFSRAGEAAGDQFGGSVASIATRTGNPEPAFVVGARLNDFAGSNAGSAHVYSALTGAQLQVLRGRAPGDWFGGAVGGGDDVDGNGIGDLIATARLADVQGLDSGSVEVHSSPVVPSTWYVDAAATGLGTGTQANPYRWIQYAIDHPTTRAGDTLLIAPGTYYENVVIDSKVLRLVGDSINHPVIDGQQLTSVLTVLENPRVGTLLSGLKITNGELYDPDPINGEDGYGAGVYAPSGCLEIRDSIITENTTQYSNRAHGIGVYAGGPRVRIINCEVANNRGYNWSSYPYGGGAGIAAGGEYVEIIDCLIKQNYYHGVNGAGLSVGGKNVIVRGCSIVENSTAEGEYGGGISIGTWGSALIDACEISRNSSRDFGAGICTYGQVLIRNCLIDSNACGEGSYDGGGVYAEAPGTEIDNCIISRNVTMKGGGTAGPLIARNSTFVGNAATSLDSTFGGYCGRGGAMSGGTAIQCIFDANDFGGAPYGSHCPASVAADASLIECTVVNNYAPPPPDYGTTFENCVLDSCIVWSNQGVFGDPLTTAIYSNVEGGQPGVGNIAVDPLFLAPIGGNYHLTSLSPCIDSGNPALPPDPDGSRADMGAYPYDPNYCPPPFSYCTGKTNSCGGVPMISSVGTPSASAATGFTISATGARAGKSGLLMYSPNGQWSAAFQGGTLCIAPQALRRGPPITSTGGTSALCDASFSIDWAAFANGALGGNPQAYLTSIGQRVNVQWWGRDSQAAGSYLSNAVQYEVCP